MHERSALASLALGLTGFGAGVAAFAGSIPALGLVGGVCALGAAGLAWLAEDEGTRPRRLSLNHPSRRRAADGAGGDRGPGGAGDGRGPGGAGGGIAAGRDVVGLDVVGLDVVGLDVVGLDVVGLDAPGHRATAHDGPGRRDGGPERAVADRAGAAAAPAGPAARGAPGTSRPLDGELLVDPLTGLYSESYLLVALDARIAAARRRLRPVSVVMVEVVRGLTDGVPRPADPALVADALRATLREADTASRMNDGRFALVLEDTPENGAIWTVERLRTCLLEAQPDHTVWAGVACYPAHAFNLDEIVAQAGTALEAAKEWRQDRIEVATAD